MPTSCYTESSRSSKTQLDILRCKRKIQEEIDQYHKILENEKISSMPVKELPMLARVSSEKSDRERQFKIANQVRLPFPVLAYDKDFLKTFKDLYPELYERGLPKGVDNRPSVMAAQRSSCSYRVPIWAPQAWLLCYDTHQLDVGFEEQRNFSQRKVNHVASLDRAVISYGTIRSFVMNREEGKVYMTDEQIKDIVMRLYYSKSLDESRLMFCFSDLAYSLKQTLTTMEKRGATLKQMLQYFTAGYRMKNVFTHGTQRVHPIIAHALNSTYSSYKINDYISSVPIEFNIAKSIFSVIDLNNFDKSLDFFMTSERHFFNRMSLKRMVEMYEGPSCVEMAYLKSMAGLPSIVNYPQSFKHKEVLQKQSRRYAERFILHNYYMVLTPLSSSQNPQLGDEGLVWITSPKWHVSIREVAEGKELFADLIIEMMVTMKPKPFGGGSECVAEILNLLIFGDNGCYLYPIFDKIKKFFNIKPFSIMTESLWLSSLLTDENTITSPGPYLGLAENCSIGICNVVYSKIRFGGTRVDVVIQPHKALYTPINGELMLESTQQSVDIKPLISMHNEALQIPFDMTLSLNQWEYKTNALRAILQSQKYFLIYLSDVSTIPTPIIVWLYSLVARGFPTIKGLDKMDEVVEKYKRLDDLSIEEQIETVNKILTVICKKRWPKLERAFPAKDQIISLEYRKKGDTIVEINSMMQIWPHCRFFIIEENPSGQYCPVHSINDFDLPKFRKYSKFRIGNTYYKTSDILASPDEAVQVQEEDQSSDWENDMNEFF